jgi:predicted amidohydrolase YtcJ
MANIGDLVVRISARRQELAQTFFNELREMRHAYGDRAVDQALATLQQQRDQVAVTK